MSVKLIINAWFTPDEEARGQYIQTANELFQHYGKTSDNVYGTDTALVGNLQPHVVVIQDWEDADRCRKCFESQAYEDLKVLRDKAFNRLDITLLVAQG